MMAPQTILSSPFLTHSVLDTLLSNSPSLQDRIQLLSAKIHLYANPSIVIPTNLPSSASPSNGTSSGPSRLDSSVAAANNGPGTTSNGNTESGGRKAMRDKERIPEMRTRLALAAVELEAAGQTSDKAFMQQAEATLRIVLDWTRGVEKGYQRRGRVAARSGVDGGERILSQSSGSHVGVLEEIADESWVDEVRTLRKEALERMIEVEDSKGRTGRIDGLKQQLAELQVMQGD